MSILKNVRKFKFANGATMELECTEEFFDIVRKQLNIVGRDPTDDELRSYIMNAIKHIRIPDENANIECSVETDTNAIKH